MTGDLDGAPRADSLEDAPEVAAGSDAPGDPDGSDRGISDAPGAPRRARAPRAPSMGVFLSYRREDSAGHAGRLYENLTKRFGIGSVFRDIDTLPAGGDFVEMIGAAVRSSDVALVIIGPRWLTASGPTGERRLDDPADFVRNEVEAALSQADWIIPVLVGGARMPTEGELPPSLASLARRNAVELTDLRWSRDVRDLMVTLARSRGLMRRIVDTYHRAEDVVYRLTRPRVLIPVAVLAIAIVIVIVVTGGNGGTTPTAALTGLLPSSFSSHCSVVSGDQYLYPSKGATATARCTLVNAADPQTINYALFANTADLQTSFQTFLSNYNGGYEGTYSHGSVSGDYGMGNNQSGAFLIFTATQPLVLAVAESNAGLDLHSWFQAGAGDPSP